MEFLNWRGITHTNPGTKDHVYIGKFNGGRKYRHWQYLIWPVCGVLSMAKSNIGSKESFETKFPKKVTFLQLYDFLKIHKKYTFNSNTTQTSCLNEI